MRTLHDMKEANLGTGDKPDYFSCRATIMHIRGENIMYPACGSENCNKKVTEGHDGWRCEKCERSSEMPTYRYMVQMAVADYTSQAWLSGFNDVGLTVFRMTANELNDIKEADEANYARVLQKATCNAFNFSCRARTDTFNDNMRVKYGISRIQNLNYEEETQSYVDLLKSDWAMQKPIQ